MSLNPKRVPRLAPLEPPYPDSATAEAVEALGPPIALFRTLARRPERAQAIHAWGRYYLSRRSALSLRHRELVIDRTTARCGAEYEWGIHIAVFAEKAALTREQIHSITAGDPEDACWADAGDRAVLRAVDALHDRHTLGDEEWAELVAATGEEGALDLLLLAGWYHAISFVACAVGLPNEPGTPSFAEIRGAAAA
jgi:alkylhydroperoxidase family enzyme